MVAGLPFMRTAVFASLLLLAGVCSEDSRNRGSGKPGHVGRRDTAAALASLNSTEVVTLLSGVIPESLLQFYSFPRSIIDLVQPGLPYAVINEAVSGFAAGVLLLQEGGAGGVNGSEGTISVGSLIANDGADSLPAGSNEKNATGSTNMKENVTNSMNETQGNKKNTRRQAPELPLDGAPQNEALQSLLIEFVRWQIPVLVLVGLGLMLALLVAVTGLCFCCCRLCGKCGANSHKYRTNHQNAKCCTCSLIFLATNLLILVGIVLGFISNDQMASGLQTIDDSVEFALQNALAYVSSTVDEVVVLGTDQLALTTDAIVSDIENIDSVLGGRIERATSVEAAVLQNASDVLFNSLDDIRAELLQVNLSISTLISLQEDFNTTAALLQASFSNLTSSCMGNTTCEDMVPVLPELGAAADFRNAENVTDTLDVIDALDVDNLRVLIQATSDISGYLSQTLNTSDFDTGAIDDIRDLVSETVFGIQNATNAALSEEGTIGAVQEGLAMAESYISTFETASYAVGSVLVSLIVAIWLVFTMGVFCGVFGYSRSAAPYERTAVSHCGAMLLLTAVGVCFLTGGLLVVLSNVLFYLGTAAQKLCNDLAPDQYTLFRQVLDNPEVWGGSTLIGAVTTESLGLPLNVSVAEFLNACHEDAPLYSALQADTFQELNLTAIITELLADLQSSDLTELDLGALEDLSIEDFVPDATGDMIEDAQAELAGSIDLPSYESTLNQTAPLYALIDIAEIISNLTQLADHFQTLTLEGASNETVAVRDDIVSTTFNSTVQSIQQELAFLEETVAGLMSEIASINTTADAVLTAMDAYFSSLGVVIPTEAGAYLQQVLGYVYAYVDSVINAAENDIGRCGPIADAYDALHTTVCVSTLDGLNGLWFSFGWCVVSLLATLVAGAVLSGYFRRGPEEIELISDEESLQYREPTGVVLTNHRVVHANLNTAIHPNQIPLHTPQYGW